MKFYVHESHELIISPWPRFIRTPCCSDAAHVTNFNNADFLSTILGLWET
jgi:hypothetical protein